MSCIGAAVFSRSTRLLSRPSFEPSSAAVKAIRLTWRPHSGSYISIALTSSSTVSWC
jgi:hypothetical protein